MQRVEEVIGQLNGESLACGRPFPMDDERIAYVIEKYGRKYIHLKTLISNCAKIQFFFLSAGATTPAT